MIEQKQKDGKWPRANGDNWRETLQTGDLIDVKDDQLKWFDCLVRCVYLHDGYKFGKCCIHYTGWSIKCDEDINISNEERLAKRHTHSTGPTRRDNYYD